MNSDSECSKDYEDRNPSPPPELQQNVEASSGDSIGETAFSKHWLFTTLMKLIQEVEADGKESTGSEDTDLDVDEDLQNELCKLWDMSMNSEVSKFLQEFKAVEILTGVIGKSKAPRVTEICVGILGNMACDADICSAMVENEKLVKMMLLLLKDPDPPTLTETTRLLYTSISDKHAAKRWVDAIKEDEEVRIDIQFILQSSTNLDLLKNTTEFVDVLLDSDEELCDKWAEEDLVISLLEAIKQVGYSHSLTLEPYLHIFQLLSTNESGVEALVSCTKRILEPLLNYLLRVCEDEIVGLDGHENCLASAISVLTVLFSSSLSTAQQLLSNADLIRCLLKVLDPLYPLVQSKISQDDTQTDKDDNEGEVTPLPKPQKNGDDCAVKHISSNNNSLITDTPEAIEDLRKLKILYSILQSFLCDIVKSFNADIERDDNNEEDEEDESTDNQSLIKTIDYLDDLCSRERIYKMLYALKESESDDLIQILDDVSKQYSKERLARILKAFKDGKSYERSESYHRKST